MADPFLDPDQDSRMLCPKHRLVHPRTQRILEGRASICNCKESILKQTSSFKTIVSVHVLISNIASGL